MRNKSTKKNKQLNNFIMQGGILAIVGILVRIIGLVKRIPLTNIIGDRGNGLYAAAYEIYSIVLLISSYSLPLAVSKLISKKLALKEYKNVDRSLKAALLFAIISGGIASIIVYYFADFFAGTLMLEPMSALALKVLSPTLFIIAIMGVIRGYFQGMGTMVPTAISQVIEQIFVVIASLIGASILFDYGTSVGKLLQNDNYAAAYGAAGGSIGPFVGGLMGLIFLMFICFIFNKYQLRKIRKDSISKNESLINIFKMLVMIILPVILSTAIYNITNIIDQRLYNQVMLSKGLDDIKTVHWGIYAGKYNVLKNIPLAIASALCASTVPEISKNMVIRGGERAVLQKISKVIKTSMIIAIPCAMAFFVLSTDIMHLLFSDSSNLTSKLLSIGSLSVIFFSLSTLTNGILQGIDKMFVPIINAAISIVIHLIVLYPLLVFTNLGIISVVIANMVFGISMCILNNIALRRYIPYKQDYRNSFISPFIASIAMGVVLWGAKLLFGLLAWNSKILEIIEFVIIALIGGIVYFIVLFILKAIDKDEVLSIINRRR